MPAKPRVAFAGTGQFAARILEAIIDSVDLRLIITRALPHNSLSPVSQLASQSTRPVLSPGKIEEIEKNLLAEKLDLLIVADYGQIIPLRILEIPRLGSLNVHPSLLPQHRGPAPIQQAILQADELTGVTLMQMDAQMDHGPIVAQSSYKLTGHESAVELELILATQAQELLKKKLPEFIAGRLQPQLQNDNVATKHGFMKRQDGLVAPQMTTERIFRLYRAYMPWPGVWLNQIIRGQSKRIKLLAISLNTAGDFNKGAATPGQWLWQSNKLYWQAQDGLIQVEKLQVEGSKPLLATEFARGYPDLFRQ
jgi:methionyl-tRNA formyltransferase